MNCVGKSLISTCTIFSKCEWMMFIKMTADKVPLPRTGCCSVTSNVATSGVNSSLIE